MVELVNSVEKDGNSNYLVIFKDVFLPFLRCFFVFTSPPNLPFFKVRDVLSVCFAMCRVNYLITF